MELIQEKPLIALIYQLNLSQENKRNLVDALRDLPASNVVGQKLEQRLERMIKHCVFYREELETVREDCQRFGKQPLTAEMQAKLEETADWYDHFCKKVKESVRILFTYIDQKKQKEDMAFMMLSSIIAAYDL